MRFASIAGSVLLVSSTVAQVVDLGYAQYRGFVDSESGNTNFLGMRYAAPPTGNMRWRAPAAPAQVSGVQDANAWPNACPEGTWGQSPTSPFRKAALTKRSTTTEDCLFLNVFVPGNMSNPSTTKLPVVFWIHGGGYVLGNSLPYNGNDLIKNAQGGVIVVTIQYRLGVWGFLPGKAIKEGGVLNAGLLDQHYALQWVQDHISKFGGDPTKVTIWGESAGAGSVLQHATAHGGRTTPPLFRAAISSSAFLPSQYRYDDVVPEGLYQAVITQANCSSTAVPLDCLRSLSTDTLETVNVNVSRSYFFGTFAFVPVIDGTFITQRPTEAFRKHQVNGNFALAVNQPLEGYPFVDPSIAATANVTDYVTQLFPLFGQKEIDTAAALYKDVGTPFDQVVAIQTETIFICPSYYFVSAFGSNSWKGEFAIPPGIHGQDLPYYFTSMIQDPAYNNTAFQKAFGESFLNFVISLDPNVKTDPSTITPQWNRWIMGTEMVFNKTETDVPVVKPVKTSSDLLKRCAFWESVGALSGQ